MFCSLFVRCFVFRCFIIGILKTDSKGKAKICTRQFQSAFTREDYSDLPSKGASRSSPWGSFELVPGTSL